MRSQFKQARRHKKAVIFIDQVSSVNTVYANEHDVGRDAFQLSHIYTSAATRERLTSKVELYMQLQHASAAVSYYTTTKLNSI
jgi:SpoVK/Ycf46/Vps4 family AAA+-type ATPase